MPQIPLETVVQRMLAAGESEANVAAVIQAYPTTSPTEGGGVPWGPALGAAALGAGAYALTRNPQATKAATAKALNTALNLRRSSMLSGLALPKSVLGAIGEAAGTSIERGSLKPIAEMLSPTTLKEAWQTFKAGPSYATSGPGLNMSRYDPFSRAIGSFDTAAQNALIRAGVAPKAAARKMLQGPLGHSRLIKSLEQNPAADFLIPFRRTPFNQLSEGLESVKPANLASTGQKARMAATLGAGAATGATADDPKTLALGTAFAGTQALPFAAAAGITRALTSGSSRKGAEAIQGLSPVSDYSLAHGIIGPFMAPTSAEGVGTALGFRPAIINAARYLRSLVE